jgi:hypothetical protein
MERCGNVVALVHHALAYRRPKTTLFNYPEDFFSVVHGLHHQGAGCSAFDELGHTESRGRLD